MKSRVEPVARRPGRPPARRRRENEAARVFLIVSLSILAAGVGSGLAAFAAWALGFARDEMGVAALVAGFVCLFWTAALISFRGL